MGESKIIKVTPGSELDRLLEEAAIRPLTLERDGIRYRLAVAERADGWPDIDPETAERMMEEVIGSISEEEADALIADIYRRREECSQGH